MLSGYWHTGQRFGFRLGSGGAFFSEMVNVVVIGNTIVVAFRWCVVEVGGDGQFTVKMLGALDLLHILHV